MKNFTLLLTAFLIIEFSYSQETQIDNTFNIGYGFNGFYQIGGTAVVNSIKLQTDNKIIIGGSTFTSFNGTPINNSLKVIRINQNGSFDIPFDNSTMLFSTIYSIDIQSDNKIIIAGNSTYNNYRIKRYNFDGTQDATFFTGTNVNDGFDSAVTKVKCQTDGKILVRGGFANFSSAPTKNLVRLNSNGSLDVNFKNNLNLISQLPSISDFELMSDGRIIVSCYANSKVFRLNSDGSLDSTFNSVIISGVYKICNLNLEE